MFKKHLLTLAVLASIGAISQAYADDLAPVINQQPNVLPPLEESAVTPAYSSAAPTDTRWYVAPFGTFITTGSGKADNGWGGGLAIGKMLDKHFNVEVKGFYNTTNYTGRAYDNTRGLDLVGSRTSGDWNLAGATIDLQYFFMRDKFSPYTVFALGGMDTDITSTHTRINGVVENRSRNAPTLIAEAGLGFTYELLDNLLVRSDVRYRFGDTFSTNDHVNNLAGYNNNIDTTRVTNDMTVNLGVVIPFGAKPKAPEYVAPAPVVVPAPVVADCSTTDADADGVNDCNDKCPNTLSGVHVNEYGCWVVDVKFDNDKSDLRHSDVRNPKVAHELEEVATAIVNHPEVIIEVQGHTSHTGLEKRNIVLGKERAATIKKYLSDRHPEIANRLNAQGYSWDRPMEGTDPASPVNRRVQLEIRQ